VQHIFCNLQSLPGQGADAQVEQERGCTHLHNTPACQAVLALVQPQVVTSTKTADSEVAPEAVAQGGLCLAQSGLCLAQGGPCLASILLMETRWRVIARLRAELPIRHPHLDTVLLICCLEWVKGSKSAYGVPVYLRCHDLTPGKLLAASSMDTAVLLK